MSAADKMRDLRHGLKISMREVEEYSRKIAIEEGNDEFFVSSPRLTQIEHTDSTPSVYKLFSLSVIYRIKFTDLLALYSIDLGKISLYQKNLPLDETHLTEVSGYDDDVPVAFPIRFDAGFALQKSNLLARMVEQWGEVPMGLIRHLDVRNSLYGYIGLKDFFLFPLIRPGSFVQIDDRRTKVHPPPWRNEFDRPIYFVELRDGYACAWAELQGKQLILIPHPLSGCGIRQFTIPKEAEIIGRVTGVAMRIAAEEDYQSDVPPKLTKPA